jgi:iron complex outermembrane receptor protein
VQTPIARRGNNTEKSGFANLTVQLGDATELSGGLRYIEYHSEGSLFVNGNRLAAADEDKDFSATIYTASLKHNFTEDLMVYASTGTSWRPGISATGDFSVARSALENSFLILDPEESTSYELGFKASALDQRLRTAVSVFHQKFDNYPYRSASGVFFVETPAPGAAPRINQFNFVAAVPVEVNGIEADVTYAPFANWDVSAVASYAKGEIKDGVIPCNDYFPHDGIPDSGGVPTVNDIRTATGGDNLSGCKVDYRSSLAPLWSGTIQSEVRMPIASLTGYARGLLSLYGSSQNDPTNAVDNYDSYELLNLYVGVRDPDGKWDVSLYGKNLFDKEEVLSRSSTVLTTPYNIGATSVTGVSNYYGGSSVSGLSMTPPREFGLIVRYSFGSH